MVDWNSFYGEGTAPVISELLHFDPWQKELADKIRKYGLSSVLEAGCGYGQTGYLIAGQPKKRVTLLDLEIIPLQTARALFEQGKRSGRFVRGDLLELPFPDGKFDLVFNAGVLEHFNFSHRCRALAEMLRCVKPGGKVVVALPNHFSLPYRYSYLYRQKKQQWPYPDEHAIYDLRKEMKTIRFQASQTRETLSPETAYHFLRRHQRIFFKMCSLVRHFEGYLSVLTLRKQLVSRQQ